MSRFRRGAVRFRHPAQLVVVAFAAAIAVGTALLQLPFATEAGVRAPLLVAVFTATSAICVTGLVVVDTATYWSGFGETVILLMIQLGGFGIMSLAAVIALIVARRVGLRRRILTAQEAGAVYLGDLRRILYGVAAFSVAFEGAAALLLTLRFWWAFDEPPLRALWLGVFHSVSAFNNAGFALWADSLIRFNQDAWILVTIAVAIIAGGIGFPVLRELWRAATPRGRPGDAPDRPRGLWTLHTRMTLGTTAVLLVVGMAAILVLEWSNPDTLAPLDIEAKLLNGFFQSVTPRTAGFNSLDYAQMRETSWLVTDVLMFIGGASGSTAGGIKVTTFALLGFVIWSELRGEPDVNAFGRRVPAPVQRQALSIALVGVGAVVVAAMLLTAMSPFSLNQALFEVISAFGTVGLSTGITANVPAPGAVLLIALMFLGRLGPLTLGAALVLRERDRLYRFPEERPIIG